MEPPQSGLELKINATRLGASVIPVDFAYAMQLGKSQGICK